MSDDEAVETAKRVGAEEAPILMLTRQQILRQTKMKIVEVPIPEWGGSVYVLEMTGKERDNFEVAQLRGRGGSAQQNMTNARAKLVAAVTVDKEGRRIFQDSDVRALGETSSKALTRIFRVATDLSGLTEKDMEDLSAALGEDQSGEPGSI